MKIIIFLVPLALSLSLISYSSPLAPPIFAATLGPVHVVADTATGLSVPQMVRTDDELIFAWTDTKDDGAHIASASVAIDAL